LAKVVEWRESVASNQQPLNSEFNKFEPLKKELLIDFEEEKS
jgi:hypothetical protein